MARRIGWHRCRSTPTTEFSAPTREHTSSATNPTRSPTNSSLQQTQPPDLFASTPSKGPSPQHPTALLTPTARVGSRWTRLRVAGGNSRAPTAAAPDRVRGRQQALLPHIRPDRDLEAIHLADDVDLEYYRLQQVSASALDLDDTDDTHVTSPTAVGTGDPEEDTAPLSEIIKGLNERFSTDFTDSDRLFLEQVKHDAVQTEDIRQTALANDLEKFSLGIRPQLEKLMIERMAGNDVLVTRCLNDADFQEIVFTGLLRGIFDEIAAQQPPARLDI